MRLLYCLSSGDIFLSRNFGDNEIPQYAVLSHTWEDESEEVNFEDMTRTTGREKAGYRKLKFCAEKSARDGLQYFWIDSCCIDKSNAAEHQHAISSMFRWYQRSNRCYVYLSDISSKDMQITQKPMLQKSRWFTRGWTLQELIAPARVEFFSKEGDRLGDKNSLEQQIHQVTGVPLTALRGDCLYLFSVKERFSWIERRETKYDEDLTYSLLGIFDMDMPLRYGEGKADAFKRLEKEITKLESCLRDIRLNDPYYHKKRIEHIRGGLLENSSRWVLDNTNFLIWRDTEENQLLWVKGDPGKGKTMLLCSIINELDRQKAQTTNLSYFFCKSADSRLNNSVAVLRGLIYMLVRQQPSLVSHIRMKYDYAGKALFEGPEAWFALSEVFVNILQDPDLKSSYLVIDALDECAAADMPKLIEFVVEKSSLSPRVKWLVSSRNWYPAGKLMERAGDKVAKLCLELNGTSISMAVGAYITHKVQQLVQEEGYNDETRKVILSHLSSNADNTFLWVALVSEYLKGTTQALIHKRLQSFPPGLESLYGRMMTQLCDSKDSSLLKHILALVATVYEPLHLAELATLVEVLEGSSDDFISVKQIVSLCGSFLVVVNHVVYFTHQSVRDYLLTKVCAEIFPAGMEAIHHRIFSRSLEVLLRKLRRNIYNLGSLGYLEEWTPQSKPDPLAALRYSCSYWVDHLAQTNADEEPEKRLSLEDRNLIHAFLKKQYLHWLEAVGLCKTISKAVLAMTKLEQLVQRTDAAALLELTYDARRFVTHHKHAIEANPLQTYVSGLIFSPMNSLIRTQFRKEEPRWIGIKPHTESQWSACLQTLEGHNRTINSVAVSNDSAWLASASDDCTVKIWDVSTGACLQTLKGHNKYVSSVVFLHNSQQLASASGDLTIRIWDIRTGKCDKVLDDHPDSVISLAFSHNQSWLASGSDDYTIKIWNVESGKCLKTLEGHSSTVSSVVFSNDSAWLASASHDCKIKIWDVSRGKCLRTLVGHDDFVNSVTCSSNSKMLASTSDDCTIRIWDASTGSCLQTLKGHNKYVSSAVFLYSQERLVSSSGDNTIRIWDIHDGKSLQTLKSHSRGVSSVAFVHNSMRFASASHDCTIKLWDVGTGEKQKPAHSSTSTRTLDVGHGDTVSAVALSQDLTRLASASYDATIKVWDTRSSTCTQTFDVGHSDSIDLLVFTHNSKRLMAASGDRCVSLWVLGEDVCMHNSLTDRHRGGRKPWFGYFHNFPLPYLQRLMAHNSQDRLLFALKEFSTTSETSSLPTFDHMLDWYEVPASAATISLDTTPALRIAIEIYRRLRYTAKLSLRQTWIQYDGKELIWLPPEYRSSVGSHQEI